MDDPHRDVRPLELVRKERPSPSLGRYREGRPTHLLPGEIDANSQIDAGVALNPDERCVAHGGIGFSVDRNDDSALSFKKLIHAEVVEMTAIGQINIARFFVECAEDFLRVV
jgi:hypothetical protein